ncbi:NGG1-interacting factor 3 [Entamoeba marina]
MKTTSFINTLESHYPKSLSESWDNTGLLIEANDNVSKVLMCIDITKDVISEAIEQHCDFILSYHPTLFKSFKKLVGVTRSQKLALELLKNNITVYSPHSIMDSVNGGVNDWLAAIVLNKKPSTTSVLDNVTAIEEKQDDFSIGAGRMVTFNEEIEINELIKRIKDGLNVPLRVAIPEEKKTVKTVAICCGSGSMMFANKCADVVLTGEMGHHEILEHVSWNTGVILSEHTNTERGYLELWKGRLQELFGGIEFITSKTDKSPLQYLC